MMRRLGWSALSVVAALAAGACGEAKADPLKATSEELRTVTSGEIEFAYSAVPEGGQPVGFKLEGPFEIPQEEGELARGDLEFTRLLGAEQQVRRFVSTGDRAWVVADGKVTEVPGQSLATLRAGSAEGAEATSAFSGLGFEQWTKESEVSDGPTVEGEATTKVVATIDPVSALNDLGRLARSLGADPEATFPNLSGDEAEAVKRSVRSSKLELITGRNDNVLRSLLVEIDFAVKGSDDLRKALGGAAGAKLVLELRLSDVNEPIDVKPPA